MNNFSIRDIEMLSGIKAHTFRIWEQRHGLCFCKRKESLHRYYDNEDLKAILRISYLYHNGYKISKIANLSGDEIRRLSSSTIADNHYELLIHKLIEATMDYDQQLFEKILQNAILQLGFENAIKHVLFPYMNKLGMLWITDHVIPAQEHFSSALVQQKIVLAISRLPTTILNHRDTVVIFSPEGERHEIPLLIAQYLLKKRGIKTVYFGADISIDELAYYFTHKTATHLYLHFITNFSNMETGAYLASLAAKFPGVKILASGPAIEAHKDLPACVRVISTMDALVPAMHEA